MKIAYFHPYFYKGIILKMRVRNNPFLAFTILFLRKSLKTTTFTPISIRELYKNKGIKSPIFQFYDTFIIQNFKIAHFTPNNYTGIVLKIEVQNGLF